jgi:LMBR1-like membrane protein
MINNPDIICRVATLPARDVPAQVKGVVAWAWLTTFLICSIVPIDVYSTLRSQDPKVILTLWDISYWSTQLLTWLLIPLYTGYASAGEFTWRGRMWASARSNAALAFFMVRYICSCYVPFYDELFCKHSGFAGIGTLHGRVLGSHIWQA